MKKTWVPTTYSVNLKNNLHTMGSKNSHSQSVKSSQCCGSGSGIPCLLTPGSRMDKKPRSGSGMNILDHISESLETILWVKILKFFDADADPGIFWTLDPGGKNSDPGSAINIPDPQH